MMTNDGQLIKATEPELIVDELNASSWASCATRRQFMEEVASRALLQTGKRVRTRTPAQFIEDLIAAGLLKEEEEELDV